MRYGLGSVATFLSVLGISPKLLPKWAIYLEKISYGLYVFHLFSLTAVKQTALCFERKYAILRNHHQALGPLRDILALVFTILLAHYSYRYLETPFLKLKERFIFVRSRAV